MVNQTVKRDTEEGIKTKRIIQFIFLFESGGGESRGIDLVYQVVNLETAVPSNHTNNYYPT